MSYDDLYNDVHSSLLKFCNTYIQSQSIDSTFDVFDFDSHATLNDLPNVNLVGIAEYSLMEMDDKYTGEAMLIVCTTQDDSNLKAMRPNISKLFSLLKTGKSIPLVRSTDGFTLGTIKIMAGSEVTPIARTQSRPLQGINFNFGLTLISLP